MDAVSNVQDVPDGRIVQGQQLGHRQAMLFGNSLQVLSSFFTM